MMSMSTQSATGPLAAIGCDLSTTRNRFVPVDHPTSRLLALSPVPTATIVAHSACSVLQGTLAFDFDRGVEDGPQSAVDVLWDEQRAGLRLMEPQNSARILNLGSVDFNAVAPFTLKSLDYGAASADRTAYASGKLAETDVFAVRTTGGNFAKVQVLSYGYDLTIRWVTYKLNAGDKRSLQA